MADRVAKTTAVAARLEDDLVRRIDAVIERLATPWDKPTRSDILRACVLEGLPVVERFAAKQEPIIVDDRAGASGSPTPGEPVRRKRKPSK